MKYLTCFQIHKVCYVEVIIYHLLSPYCMPFFPILITKLKVGIATSLAPHKDFHPTHHACPDRSLEDSSEVEYRLPYITQETSVALIN